MILPKELREIVKVFLPDGKNERLLLFFILLIYSLFCIPIALDTFFLDYESVIQKGRPVHDVYFGFDSHRYFHFGKNSIVPHPLIYLITKPFLYISDVLIIIFQTLKAKTIFSVLITMYCVSMSAIIVYRFLKRIVVVDNFMACLLTLMFSYFATNIYLSFTFESFTFSLLLLAAMMYFYSCNMLKNRSVSFLSDAFFCLLAGGITITNFGKGIVSIFFGKYSIQKRFKRIALISVVFVLVVLLAYILFDEGASQSSEILWHYKYFSSSSMNILGYIIYVIDTFFIAPILSFDFRVVDHGAEPIKSIWLSINYNHSVGEVMRFWYRYIFAAIFYGMIFTSVLMNRKNKIVLFLFSLWGLDFLLHIILKFGVIDGYFMYSAHWVYLLPIFLGFLYNAVKDKYRKIFISGAIFLFIAIVVNNSFMLHKFISIVYNYYLI